ncbi:DUF4440 domain-containing protein [Buttiauxella warmboldiae]|uniref:DUF4440 domain-containing protein n=1 Tax=Buttiauxella warmboldiae TaxID=82993 RepID=A0A3N5DZ57_9ENTR|nr:nuclear transport factor 2 family protein [Buttiauxella warmboldiae]RPH24003.1 DUF4440 domain-containing protein [Buttiauxella warmboldiae]
MRNFTKIIVATMMLVFANMAFAASSAPANTPAPAPQAERQLIIEMINKYTQSVNSGDVHPELINDLWEHSPDVSNINIRGHQKGFDDIRKNFYPPIFRVLKDRNLRMTTTPREPAIYFFDNTAVVEFYWLLNATLIEGNKPVEMAGRETHVYRKADGQWKLVHLHYSGMPVAGF